jgi:ribonucleoside-diphosphate reductase alpha chain
VETVSGQDVSAGPPAENTDSADLAALTELSAPAQAPRAAHADAPYCMQCGVQMQRAGSCHACPSCGTTSGCS